MIIFPNDDLLCNQSLINDVVNVTVLESGLNKNFADAKVSVTDCPDLTQDPFRFPVKGERRHHFIHI